MDGFLSKLIQRSSTNDSIVRPSPLSTFEPGYSSPTLDAPQTPPFQSERSATDDTGTIRRLVPDVDRVSLDAAESATGAGVEQLHATETTLRVDPSPAVSGGPVRGHAQKSPGVEKRAPTIGEPHTHIPLDQAESRFVLERPSVPGVEKQGRRIAPAGEVPKGRAKPRTPTDTATERDNLDPIPALTARRFHVRGKSAERPDPGRSEAASHMREHPSTSPGLTQGGRGDSLDRAAADGRGGSAPQNQLRIASSDVPPTPAPAILTPRLPPPEPMVHVTIGRVEIRAVAAPTEQKRSAQLRPTLSLGDYLRRRNGGRG
jgi:hypothetical protein